MDLNILNTSLPSPIQEFDLTASSLFSKSFRERDIRIFLKRDDLLGLEVQGTSRAFCGNKWRKLKYNLLEAAQSGHSTLLTFGGAFSNHIAAVAAAGQQFGFQTIGIIRGEQVKPLNPTLAYAKSCGMQLAFVTRSAYREKHTEAFQDSLSRKYGTFYPIPEGGTNALALKGAAELPSEIIQQLGFQPNAICVCCGTGGTLAGIIQGLEGRCQAIGYSVLKGDFMSAEVAKWLQSSQQNISGNWQIRTEAHHGGYAKYTSSLIDFINQFKLDFNIQLDPIYTGKLMYALAQEAEHFPKGSSIVAIHSGGLQGIAGFNERFGGLIKT